MNPFDILIIGAGPAGTTAALKLGTSGLKVGLIDKAVFPRDKICGDALSGKVVSALKYTDLEAMEALHQFPEKNPSWGIRFYSPKGDKLDVPFKKFNSLPDGKAPGYIATRKEFDHFLLEQVKQKTPTEIFEGCEIKKIERTKEGFVLEAGEQSFQSRLLIGADGAHSIVKRHLTPQKHPKKYHAAGLRRYYKGVTGFAEENFVELHFLDPLLPGYFWLFPLPGGLANTGLGLRSDIVSKKRLNIKKMYEEVIQHHPAIAKRFKEAEPVEPIRGFGLPLGSTWRQIRGDGFMLTGDAAGFIDPFSGEGIGNAMLSGKGAAEQAMRSFQTGDLSMEGLKGYETYMKKKIGRELQISYQMQKLVRYPRLMNFAVRKASTNPSLQSMMSMMFDDLDIRKELAKPSFYWNLLWG
ncbi:MAG: geranylgeranyl reductase family protein [Bacteroidota bacterium]